MNIQSVRSVAKAKGVNPAGRNKSEIIRAIQRAEGNFDCFGSAMDSICDQERCAWRADCLPGATASRRSG